MPWLEWCPDPQQPDAQWVKIFHPGSWTPQDERDDPPPPHTYIQWKEFYAPNLDQEGGQPTKSIWYKRDWATEGYWRVAAPEADHGFNSMSSPDQHSVATQSSALCMSPQMLNAILRSSDASALLRISLVFKMGSVSNCRIARVRRPISTNQYVHLVELNHLNLLSSLIHIYLRPNHAAPTTRRSLSSS